MSLLYNEKNIIRRECNYYTERKLVSIHSTDRDVSKWPNSSYFEVDLPEDLVNISSIRLVNSSIPNNLYVFSHNYQNTKLKFTVMEDISGSTDEKTYLANYYAANLNFDLTIDEGYYEPEELAYEIQAKLNQSVTTALLSYSGGVLDAATYVYDKFRVKYNKTQHKFYFINLRDNFELLFDLKIDYTGLVQCNQKEVWDQYDNWGLPYNLGFNREKYTGTLIQPDLAFFYDNTVFSPSTDSTQNGVYYAKSSGCADLFGETCIYLELDKYNSMDEIEPYSTNTNSLYNNDYNGKINGAFAKIPLFGTPYSQIYDSKNGFINNITFFKTPLPRLKKMKFKFRYHDGRLVDFKNLPFSLTIEVMQHL
jgi:hypothetical protein